MKKILFCFLIVVNVAHAQSLVVEYQLRSGSKKFYKENYVLKIFEHQSIYYSIDKLKIDSTMDANPQRVIGKQVNSEVVINNKNSFTIYDMVFTSRYVYKDTVELKWQLLNDKDTCLGYMCHKASTAFRGKKWEVLYTEDIPTNFSPWKLNGLPGLILKAEADSGKIEIAAVAFKISTRLEPDLKEMQKGAEKILRKSFLKRRDHYYSNMAQYYKNDPKMTLIFDNLKVNGRSFSIDALSQLNKTQLKPPFYFEND